MYYRFEDFELDTENYRLEKNGQEVHLQPRVLDFLAYLIANRGRLVTKAELVEAVWEGQVVSDSVFSRCAYELRKALRESSQEPRFLQTVHGKGFRFLGEVKEETSEVGVPSLPPPTPRRVVRNFHGQRGILVTLVLALLPLGWWFFNPSPETEIPAISILSINDQSLPTVAIAPLGVGRSDSQLEMIGLSVADLLYHHLVAEKGLVVRPLASSYEVLERESLQAFAEDLGAQFVISGSLESLNFTQVRLDLYLHEFGENATSTPLGQYDLPKDSPEGGLQAFVQVRDSLGRQLGRIILPALAPATLEGVPTPSNPQAYRLYLEALQKVTLVYCDPEVIELLRQSLRLDPRFYPSWELLAVAYYNQYAECGGDGELFLPLAFDSAGEASLLSSGRSEVGLMRSMVYIERGEVERAWEEFHQGRESSSSIELANRIYLLRFTGFLHEAERQLAKLFTVDPLYMKRGVTTEAPMTLLYLGEAESFLFYLPRQDNSYHLYNLGIGQLYLGRIEEALESFDRARRKNPGRIFSRYADVLGRTMRGEVQEALNELEALREETTKSNFYADGEMHYRQASLYAMAGDQDGALEELRSALHKNFLCHLCVEGDPAFESYKEMPDYRKVVEQMYQGHRLFAERFDLNAEPAPPWM